MPRDAITDAVLQELVDARTVGRRPEIPQVRDLTVAEALAVQLQVADRFGAQGRPIGGWKLGMTSGPAFDGMGVGVRPHGYILDDLIFASGAHITLNSHSCAVGVEPELCLIAGRDVPADITVANAREYFTHIAPSLEILQLRMASDHEGWIPSMIADGMVNGGLIVGTPVSVDLLEKAVSAKLIGSDGYEGSATPHVDVVFDDHLETAVRLVKSLAERGKQVKAGHKMITGAFVKAPVTTTTTFTAEFAAIGSVTATITP